ncbi:MAG: apolipoprotein N-acyltransferase [Myxococcales bacterium]
MSESTATVPLRRESYALAVVGGVAYFLGWAGFGIWPLALICLVPLWAALELGLERRWWHSLVVGWLYGTVAYAGGYHWLIEFLRVFSGYGYAASVLFWLLFTAYLGFNYALYGAMYWALRQRGWPAAASAIPPLLVMEWLYPALFPTYLGNSLHTCTTLVQIADLGGPLSITVLLALVNLSIFEGWRWFRRRRDPPLLVFSVTVVVIAFAAVYGVVRIHQLEAQIADAPKLRVGLVQVDMGIFEKRSEAEEGHRRHIEQSHQLEDEGDLDLIVWPESAYIDALPREVPWYAGRVREDLHTPLLFGGVSTERVEGKRKFYNTVFAVDADGFVQSTYDKTYLLMFGEYLPFGDLFPILYDLSPNSGRFTPGTHVRPVTLGPWRIATPVCYEDVLAGFTRKMVREGKPHILINLTNDAWFGDTQEPWIHLVLAKYRAIEHRRYLVRATNSGISAIIDPLGRVVARTGLLTRENLRYEVSMLDEDTMYTELGDWPGWLALALMALMLMVRRNQEQ